jgi:hypothetical protein
MPTVENIQRAQTGYSWEKQPENKRAYWAIVEKDDRTKAHYKMSTEKDGSRVIVTVSPNQEFDRNKGFRDPLKYSQAVFETVGDHAELTKFEIHGDPKKEINGELEMGMDKAAWEMRAEYKIPGGLEVLIWYDRQGRHGLAWDGMEIKLPGYGGGYVPTISMRRFEPHKIYYYCPTAYQDNEGWRIGHHSWEEKSEMEDSNYTEPNLDENFVFKHGSGPIDKLRISHQSDRFSREWNMSISRQIELGTLLPEDLAKSNLFNNCEVNIRFPITPFNYLVTYPLDLISKDEVMKHLLTQILRLETMVGGKVVNSQQDLTKTG